MNSLLLFCLFMFSSFYHADGLGEYHYYLEENHILVSFEMDQHELQGYLNSMDCGSIAMVDLCTTNYIKTHTELFINDRRVFFEYSSSAVYNGHAIVKLKSKNTFQKITDIKLKNHTFYEINPDFKNRIWIELDSFEKSYMLRIDSHDLHLF